MMVKCACGYCNEYFEEYGPRGYRRKFILGHNAKGVNNHGFKGGKDNTDKRPMIWMPDHPNADKKGYVYEHVKVMSELLGRPLRKGEVVHHINGDVKNNDPSNLQLFSSQAEHMSITMAKDMSDRKCSQCGSNTTQTSKNGWSGWYNDGKGGFLCRKCYTKKNYKYVKKGRKN